MQKEAVQYDCKLCDKMYASNQSLGNHIAKHHPNPRRVEDASIGFMVLDSSPPHNAIHKKPEKIHSCKQCPYVSGHKAHFKRHIETHTSNKVKTGRPKKSPEKWSSVTKRLYAKKSKQEFEENMKECGLSEDIEKLLKKDSQKFFENHPNYNHKDKSSEKYGEAILAAIVQFNSNNLDGV